MSEHLSVMGVTKAEFSGRPKVETSRGTEVAPSGHGDRLVAAANRIASFMDRLKGGKTELVETATEKLDQGKAFLKSTGEKAVATAVKAGNVIGGAALATAEFGVGAVVIGAEAAGKGAKKAKEALDTGLDKADAWLSDRVSDADAVIRSGVAKVGEFTQDTVNTVKEKGVAAKEAVTGSVEAVKGFFQARAEKAKSWKEKFVRNNVARYSRARRGVINTVETGKAYAEAGVETAKRHGRATRMAGKAALSAYRYHASGAAPRMAN